MGVGHLFLKLKVIVYERSGDFELRPNRSIRPPKASVRPKLRPKQFTEYKWPKQDLELKDQIDALAEKCKNRSIFNTKVVKWEQIVILQTKNIL